jgi:putative endonuclease
VPRDNPRRTPPRESESTGRRGEEIATRYLERRGCVILARNWRAGPGEVDIIAECPALGTLAPNRREYAFVEVRTRHGGSGLAEESISRRKATSMASAAYTYLSSRDLDPDATSWRIDLVAISMSGDNINSINWIQGAISEDMLNPPA